MEVDFDKVFAQRSLPIVRRGYDRDTTDALLEQLRVSLERLLTERDAAVARADELGSRADGPRARMPVGIVQELDPVPADHEPVAGLDAMSSELEDLAAEASARLSALYDELRVAGDAA